MLAIARGGKTPKTEIESSLSLYQGTTTPLSSTIIPSPDS
jgi:hypothetical protein